MSIDSGRRYFTFLLKRVIIIHKKGTDKLVDNVLEVNGLSLDILEALSYRSRLGISLKKNLHYFDKDALLEELIDMSEWLSEQPILDKIALDFRVKSEESIRSKYDRYYPDHQVRKVFNDIIIVEHMI